MESIMIKYKGEEHEVQIDDDVPFGKLDDILKKCVPKDAFSLGVKGSGEMDFKIDLASIDTSLFKMLITLAAVTKAPWQINNQDVLRQIGHKTLQPVFDRVLEIYSPMDFLYSNVRSMGGGRLLQEVDAEVVPSIT